MIRNTKPIICRIGAQLKTKNALEKYVIPQFAIVGD